MTASILGGLTAIAAPAQLLAADGKFMPLWNDVCGIGSEIELGCENIRSREIIDASKKPWSAVGRVNYAGYNAKQHCTGTLISERHFITAAHCLFNPRLRKWIDAKQIHFVAGFQRGDSVSHSIAKSYILSEKHNLASGNFHYVPSEDWAIVELENNIGNKTGYIQLTADINSSDQVFIAGYPGLREFVLSSDRRCGKLRVSSQSRVYLHDCVTMHGDSGGPVLREKNGRFEIIAITSGVTLFEGKAFSYATPVKNITKSALPVN